MPKMAQRIVHAMQRITGALEVEEELTFRFVPVITDRYTVSQEGLAAPGSLALLAGSSCSRPGELLTLEKGDQRVCPTSRNGTRYGAPVICYRDGRGNVIGTVGNVLSTEGKCCRDRRECDQDSGGVSESCSGSLKSRPPGAARQMPAAAPNGQGTGLSMFFDDSFYSISWWRQRSEQSSAMPSTTCAASRDRRSGSRASSSLPSASCWKHRVSALP